MTTPTPSARNSIWKAFAPVIVILVLVVGGLYGVKSHIASRPGGSAAMGEDEHSGTADSLKIGSILPDFQLDLYGSGGKTVQASTLKSKVTLINFWATWCEACMVEMPSIVKVWQSYKDKGFDVASVNVDQNPEAVLPKTLKRLGMEFPVYTDKDSKLADLFQIQAIPLSVIIDRNRKILFIENGERDWNGSDIRAEIEKWLSG
jgi:thiol-disulfide isomerase/thioredoxin